MCKHDKVGALHSVVLIPSFSHPSSWESRGVTSLGRKGNTKIAGQASSQRRTRTSDWTNVFPVRLISANCSLLSLCLPPLFIISPISPPPSLSLPQTLWSWKQGHTLDSWQAAVCGAFAGAGDYLLLWEKGRRSGGVENGWMIRWMDG